MKLCFSLDGDNGDDDEKGDGDDSENDGAGCRKTEVTMKMVNCSLPLPDHTRCLISD